MNKLITFPFSADFIDQVADFLTRNYIAQDKDLRRVAVVFPGKRPSLFLKRKLSQIHSGSFFPPKFFAIDEFMSLAAAREETFTNAKELDQCYALYQLASHTAPQILKGRESFSAFLPWIREILAFIDQLDLENVDNEKLEHVQDNAAIGYAVPKDINVLLQSIVALRTAYHGHMRKTRAYSRGFQYLRAAQSIARVGFQEFEQILFCNFFYLHRSEEMVIQELYRRDQAVLLLQGDEREWPVLKRLARHFDHEILEAQEPAKPKFFLKLYSGFDVHSQVCQVRDILGTIGNLDEQGEPRAEARGSLAVLARGQATGKGRPEGSSLDDTVIVLANNHNLIPLLSEIAVTLKDFNVSMGYPLRRSALYSLLELVFQAQLSRSTQGYYTRDYLKVLRHPLVKNLDMGQGQALTRILVHKIEEILTGQVTADVSGAVFLNFEDLFDCDELYDLALKTGAVGTKRELKSVLKDIHQFLFSSWEKVKNFTDFALALEDLLEVFVEKSPLEKYPLNLKIASRLLDVARDMRLVSFGKETFPPEDIFKIAASNMEREMVSFSGSPLKGLQILGLFETRSLNFENVIIMDANEGVLPHLNIYEPLIPREVMIGLNLDRLELEEEIQRYQVMRLMASAKNVHLVYQESRDKEKSRFVQELIWEAQKKAGSMDAVSVAAPGFKVKVALNRREVQKTPDMIRFLKDFRYSSSSINMYLRNPIEFYENYVLGLREKDNLLEEPENRQVGIFVHGLLEQAFSVFLNKKPVIDKKFRGVFTRMFEERFQELFGKSLRADNFLLKSVLEERLERFLNKEAENQERDVAKILFLERRFEDKIPLSSGQVSFVYQMDRVDELSDGSVLILDYKTGSIDPMPKAMEHIESMELSRENIRDSVKSFQIPLYFYYLDKNYPDKAINAAFYNLRTTEIHKFLDSGGNHDRGRINRAFLRALDFVVKEILDPEINFIEDSV